MRKESIYSKRGGGFMQSIRIPNGAYRVSWPLAKLELHEERLTFSLPGRRCEILYSEIVGASISKMGYVIITCTDMSKNFGFTWVDLPDIIKHLRDARVPIQPKAVSNMRTALIVIRAQVIFACVFMILWLSGLITILTLAAVTN